MSDKFQYAPGRPGYGDKGDKGDDGMQGMSMYFTDLNPVEAASSINLRIAENKVLWSDSIDPLPQGRVYITGDLFFDNTGKCYEIDAENDTFSYKLAALTLGGLFNPLGVTTLYGFERYFNSNTIPKYIVDNVYTVGGAINYSLVPEKIYNVPAKDYTRNEFTNVVHNGTHNAFTVYSATNVAGQNNRSIALVRETASNTFRLGNLDDAGNLRNVNLTFDVSSLVHNKSAAHQFDASTPSGAILTNYEINANSLFDPNFNPRPASFFSHYNSPGRYANLNWNLLDFVDGDTDVRGDLYFFKDVSGYNAKSFSVIDVSISPLVFTGVDTSGYVRINNLDNTANYKFFMKLYKNGWVRTSDVMGAFAGQLLVTPTSLLNEPSAAHTISGFNVVSTFAWDVSLRVNPDEFMFNLVCTSVGDGNYDGSIFFDMTENTDLERRFGEMRVLGGETRIIQISQRGQAVDVSVRATFETEYSNTVRDLTKEYNLYFDNMPFDTVVDVSIAFYTQGSNEDDMGGSIVSGETLMTITKADSLPPIDASGLTYQELDWDPVTSEATGYVHLTGLTYNDFPLRLILYVHYEIDDPGTLGGPDITISIESTDVAHTHVSGPPITIVGTSGLPVQTTLSN